MRIAFTTNVWGRFHVLEVWSKAIDHIQEAHPDIEIIKIAAGSEGEKSERHCRRLGIEYVESENLPLWQKSNNRLKFTRDFNPDYVVLLGSDDIINIPLFNKYLELINKGADLIEIMDIYFFNTEDGRASYCKGYTNHRRGEPLAPGRVISKKLLSRHRWQIWYGKGTPDYDANRTLRMSRNKHRIILKDSDMAVLDIKTNGNINPFTLRVNHEPIEAQEFLDNYFPYLKKQINELHPFHSSNRGECRTRR